jgi:hypothetical protein
MFVLPFHDFLDKLCLSPQSFNLPNFGWPVGQPTPHLAGDTHDATKIPPIKDGQHRTWLK